MLFPRRFAWLNYATFILMIALLVGSMPNSAKAYTLQTQLWSANDEATAITVSGKNIFFGGLFTYVGQATGNFVEVDASSGVVNRSFPRVAGTVLAIVPDGAGGWFIGGRFNGVNGVARTNLAHILPNKTLDTNWVADVSGGDIGSQPAPGVYSLAVRNGIVYAGGNFSTVGGQARRNLAALNATSGALASWAPEPDGWIYSIVPTASTTYVGGTFTSIGGQNRNYIAALNTSDGNATSWNPNADSPVNVLAFFNDLLYTGGEFHSIGGQARNYLAALSISNGQATAWNPDANHIVKTLQFANNKAYVGGLFSLIGGQVRNNVAAIDLTTGKATDWNPNPDNLVLTLSVVGNTVYLGGGFSTIGGQPFNYAAAVDATTGAVLRWKPNPNYQVQTLAVSGNSVLMSGDFTFVNGLARTSLAALDVTTGKATAWNPQINGEIHALAVRGNTLYVGGLFDSAGGQPRSSLAAFDITSGALLPWHPILGGASTLRVLCMAITGNTVFVGGNFGTVNAQERIGLAAVTADAGDVLPWKADATAWFGPAMVTGMAQRGTNLYVSGTFSKLAASDRKGLGAVDTATGAVQLWNPDVNGQVNTIVPTSDAIYIGGGFSSVGGQPIENVAALNPLTGAANLAWKPNPVGSVAGIAVDNQRVYIGGYFTEIGGKTQRGLAAVDRATGDLLDWNPNLDKNVGVMTLSTGMLYVGGPFTQVLNEPQMGIAGISVNTAASLVGVHDIQPTSAIVEGLVNANGIPTTYKLEVTTASGNYTNAQVVTPLPSQGSAAFPVLVSAKITGLAANTTYYYRLIATNSQGSFVSAERSLHTSINVYVPVARRS